MFITNEESKKIHKKLFVAVYKAMNNGTLKAAHGSNFDAIRIVMKSPMVCPPNVCESGWQFGCFGSVWCDVGETRVCFDAKESGFYTVPLSQIA